MGTSSRLPPRASAQELSMEITELQLLPSGVELEQAQRANRCRDGRVVSIVSIPSLMVCKARPEALALECHLLVRVGHPLHAMRHAVQLHCESGRAGDLTWLDCLPA